MARNEITTTVTGNTDILDDLESLGDQFPDMVKECFMAQQTVIRDAIRKNWVSMAGGKAGDFIYDSVGFSTEFGSNGLDVVGTAGVYKIDSIAGVHGRAEMNDRGYKPLTASQIAYWVEFGTSRLRSGQRKSKKGEYDESQLISIAPKPFIGNAFYNTINEQEKAFAEKWSELMSKVVS